MTKINYPDRSELREIHLKIQQEYAELLKLSDGRNKLKTLEYLAEKYGYSSGQAVRNMLNNLKKKTKQTSHGIN